MRRELVLLSLVLVVGLVTGQMCVQAAPRRRLPRRIDDGPPSKNVYEIRGTLKGYVADGDFLVVNVIDDEDPTPQVAAFKITGETVIRGLKEGQTFADLPEGKSLFIFYRASNLPDYKGTALLVRVLPLKPAK